MHNKYTIERAQISDIEGIVAVRRAVWLDTYVGPEKATREDALSRDYDSPEKLEEYRKQITDGKRSKDGRDVYHWVAKQDGKVVGFTELQSTEDGYYLQAMLILKSARSHGVGGKFLEEIQKHTGEDTKLRLDVAVFNTRAIEFYRRHGFHLMDESESSTTEYPSGRQVHWRRMGNH